MLPPAEALTPILWPLAAEGGPVFVLMGVCTYDLQPGHSVANVSIVPAVLCIVHVMLAFENINSKRADCAGCSVALETFCHWLQNMCLMHANCYTLPNLPKNVRHNVAPHCLSSCARLSPGEVFPLWWAIIQQIQQHHAKDIFSQVPRQ